MATTYLGTWIFVGGGAEKGFLSVEEGTVVEVNRGEAPKGTEKSIVLPSFVNAHTHIGDSLAYPAPRGSLEDMVAPPSGYKHRVLRSASRGAKIDAMRQAMILMSRTGTSDFIDFREEGLEGVRSLEEAMTQESPRATILGRPASTDASSAEIDELITGCAGVAMSAVRDWDYSMLSDLSSRARAAGKMFSVHASEGSREDIDRVLDLKPDFLVHMTSATAEDLKKCASEQVPVVLCPRSNKFFGLNPDFAKMKSAGVEIAFGTDNGMIARPDMFEEMKAARLTDAGTSMTPSEIVSIATMGGRKVLNAKAKITTEIGPKSDMTVVAVRGEDPLLEVVTRSTWQDVRAVVKGGRVRRSDTWRT